MMTRTGTSDFIPIGGADFRDLLPQPVEERGRPHVMLQLMGDELRQQRFHVIGDDRRQRELGNLLPGPALQEA